MAGTHSQSGKLALAVPLALVLRGEVLRLIETDFVRLAIVAGCTQRRIICGISFRILSTRFSSSPPSALGQG